MKYLNRPLTPLVLLIATLLLTTSCTTISYYAQSIHGHFSLLHAATPIADQLADPNLDPKLRNKLTHVLDMRAFASRELGLPDNRSYTSYADLKRPFAVWSVYATPALSLRPVESCFPIAGCLAYRGYFDKADADRAAAALRDQGYDVNVAGVPAYSTLGWFDDPVLNTFIQQPDAEVARLIFHELAHQHLYVADDSMFNESFATAVEQAGVRRWLESKHDAQLSSDFAAHAARRDDFLQLLRRYRQRLVELYAQPIDDQQKRIGKQAVFAALRDDYRQIKQTRWNGYAGYDRYFAQELNNAHLAAIAVYHQWVPAFTAMLGDEPLDRAAFDRFYQRAQQLARCAKPVRDAALQQWIDAPQQANGVNAKRDECLDKP